MPRRFSCYRSDIVKALLGNGRSTASNIVSYDFAE
jgi:hypothetical protein